MTHAGAPELAPVVRYISSFLDLEWSAIKGKNKGQPLSEGTLSPQLNWE